VSRRSGRIRGRGWNWTVKGLFPVTPWRAQCRVGATRQCTTGHHIQPYPPIRLLCGPSEQGAPQRRKLARRVKERGEAAHPKTATAAGSDSTTVPIMVMLTFPTAPHTATSLYQGSSSSLSAVGGSSGVRSSVDDVIPAPTTRDAPTVSPAEPPRSLHRGRTVQLGLRRACGVPLG
jgi:hypothetical protein